MQEYVCPACSRAYTTLQAPFLIQSDGLFHCEECNSLLESSADGAMDGLSRRERTKAVKAKQVQPATWDLVFGAENVTWMKPDSIQES